MLDDVVQAKGLHKEFVLHVARVNKFSPKQGVPGMSCHFRRILEPHENFLTSRMKIKINKKFMNDDGILFSSLVD